MLKLLMDALLAKKCSSFKANSAKRRRNRVVDSSLSFEALEPRQLLATIVAADGGGVWSNSSTWVGGVVPGANDRVLIGQHTTTESPILVTLNSAVPHVAKEIVVNGGTLRVLEGAAGSAERTLTTEWMHVNSGGTFRVGLATDRYDNNSFRLTLAGSDPTADWNVQTATGSMNITDNNGFLMTASGGQLKFFGDEKLSFTKLAATAEAGSNTITVENVIERNFDGTTSAASDGALDWQVGDEIVIASSSYDYADEEVRTITAINSVPGNPTLTRLTLNASLAHRHYGEVESYSNPARTFDIDLRAEVALLNRMINIEGTQDTDNSFGDRENYGTGAGENVGIGAHTMIMPGSGQITIDGVRFDKMGQTGRVGRYPVHWHVAGNRSGDVMRNSSVTNSNNRGITIHGTQNVLLEDNVLHDIHGHGFFMEDAAETGNQFLSNIVLGIHKVGGKFNGADANDPFIVPGITRSNNGNGTVNGEAPRNGNGEGSHDTGQNFNLRFVHSAAYWITNPDNTWVGNVSAGSEGTGFWFALPDEVIGLSKDTGLYNSLDPNNTNLDQFDNNTTHSSPVGLTFDRGADILPGSSNNYSPPTLMHVKGLTGYKHDGTAVYHRGSVGKFSESRFADNDNSSFNTFRQEENSVLFVGHSRGNADLTNSVGGYRLYDGPGRIVNSHFAGFAADNAFMFRVEGGANKHSHTQAQGITFEADGSANHLSIEFKERDSIVNDNSPVFVSGRPDGFSGLVLDVDGSLTGHAGGGAGYVLTPKLDFYRDSTDIAPAGWDAYISDDRFGQLKLGTINDVGTIPDYRIENGDGNAILANRRNLEFVQRQYVKVNAGDYTVDFQQAVPNTGFDVYLEVQAGWISGDATVLRFLDVAEDFKPTSGSSVNSLTQLRAANQTSWLRDYAGDLWMKVFESNATIEVRPTNDSLPTNPQAAFVPTVVNDGARIEAEEFDLGGQGFAFWDTTAGNSGGAFRPNQGVDIQATTDAGGGFNVGWTADGEFMEYTTDIAGGVYDIGFRVASSNSNAKSIRLLVGDGDAAETITDLGVIDVPNTGGTQSWQTLVLNDIDLTAWQGADRVLRVEIIGGSFNLNWLEFNDQQAPFVTQTIADDARVLVEEFDLGGAGVAYHDTTPGNSGGTARLDEDVDIGGASLVLTNITDGEWLEFTRDVTPGIYNVVFRVLSNNANPTRSIRLLAAENDTTEDFTFLGSVDPAGTTTGYENFVLQNVDLTSFGGSDRVFRLEFVGGQHNFNWFEFKSAIEPSSVVTRGVAYGGTTASYGEDAIDITKSAYLRLPGTNSTLASYTNYTQGLNRVVVELANSQQATLTTADFDFRVGNTNDPSEWELLDGSSAIPLPTVINGTRNSSTGQQRFTLAWEDTQTIKNQWLQVTVNAGANTGLTSNDVFYFGNQIADVFGTTFPGSGVVVNEIDTILIRANQSSAPNSVGMNNIYDIDRNGSVNAIDTIFARANQASGDGLLMLAASEQQAALAFSAFASVMETTAVETTDATFSSDVNPRSGSSTIVAADGGGNWQSSSTWIGGVVPNAGDRVLIGKHTTTDAPILVTLNSAVPHIAKEIVVNGGTLRVLEGAAGSAERTLSADWMHVNSGGTFRVGLANDRYDNNSFRLTLTGTDPTADWPMVETATGTIAINDNDGFLMTALGGQLQFFGDEKLSFTKLAATAEAGSNTITVENVIERNFDGTTSAASDGELDWQVGDEIVIASSSYDYADEEVRTITAINSVPGDPTQTRITLNASLAHRHYGEVESYSNPNRTFDIDLRAEVALLNRTINIEGTQDTDDSFGDRANYGTGAGQNVGIGAHAMIMPGSGQITIDGVRFDQMGQTGRLGRYPVHWHVAGNRSGDVMRNSSVTNSNNRGITIHGTQNVLLEDNVLHDIHGHGFFMEDAAETGNQFISNIVLGIHKVGGDDDGPDANDPFIVPGITRGNDGKVNGEAARNGNGESSHDTGENNSRRFLHSAAYWITNPDNTWVGNVSAGSEGTGFWFALPDAVLGLSKDTGLYNNLDPNNTNLGQFDHNTSHSSPIGLTFDRGADLLAGSSKNYHPPQIMQVNHFTGYKHDGTAVYHRAQRGIFNESRFADNAHSSFNTFNQQEQNVLFVGHSRGNSDPNAQVAGYKLYDGPGRIKNSHFAGFAAANAHTFMVEPGSRKHSHHAAEGISYENDGTANHLSIEFITRAGTATENVPEYIFGRPHSYSGILLDVDGSLTGHAGGGPNHVLVPKLDFNRDSDDITPAGWNAYISNDRYAELRLNVDADELIPNFRITNGAGHFMDVDRRNVISEQWLYAKVNAGDYTVDFFEALPASGFEAFLEVRTFGQSGDATVLRFVGVGEDFKPNSGISVSSLSELRQASQTSYLRDYAGDLWMNIFESNTKIQIDPTNDPLPPNPQSALVPTTIQNGTRIEAEYFDLGGQGIATLDTTPGNAGNVLRPSEDVDIQATTDEGGGFNVGWMDDGEFLEYTTDIAGDVYDIGFRVASNSNEAKSIRLLVGNGNAAETFTELGVIGVPNTGGDQTWQTLVLEDVDLTAWQGTDRILRVEIIGGSFNLNWLEFNDQQAPLVTQTIAGTTRVSVEAFDLGGEGIAYHDTTLGNSGGTARVDENVDIGGQFLVLTNIADGEWLEFTRDITPGIYDVVFRVFTNRSNPNRSIRLLVADNDTTETYNFLGSVDPTGTLGVYENFVIPNVDLTSFGGSDKVLRLEFVGGQHNFDWFEFQSVTQPSSVVTRGVAYGGSTAAYGEDAIDTTKSAYLHLPGTSSSAANYTNYTQGLNRVIVDLANSQQATLTTADFEFRVGNTNDPSDPSEWQLLDGSSAIPLPTVINGIRNSSTGQQRFTLAWEGTQTIKNQWLQVTVKAGGNTGLISDDVFYFGNQIADVFGSTSPASSVAVNAIDTMHIRANQSSAPNSVGITNVYDIDRNGAVNAIDTILARAHQASGGGLLMLAASEPQAAVAFSAFASVAETAAVETTVPVATHSDAKVVASNETLPLPIARANPTPEATDLWQGVSNFTSDFTSNFNSEFNSEFNSDIWLRSRSEVKPIANPSAQALELRDNEFRSLFGEQPLLNYPIAEVWAHETADRELFGDLAESPVDEVFAAMALMDN